VVFASECFKLREAGEAGQPAGDGARLWVRGGSAPGAGLAIGGVQLGASSGAVPSQGEAA
jgi:hypothetical protein